jgi:hypothetical protein
VILGGDSAGADDATERRYTVAELARLCGVGAVSVRAWIARGLLPAPRARSLASFGFRELARGRTLTRLLRAGWSAQRIAKAVAAARAIVPDIDAALSGIDPDAGHNLLAVRLPDGRLCTEGGQGLLDFAATPAPGTVRGMRGAGEWFQAGVELEAVGRLAEAPRRISTSATAATSSATPRARRPRSARRSRSIPTTPRHGTTSASRAACRTGAARRSSRTSRR